MRSWRQARPGSHLATGLLLGGLLIAGGTGAQRLNPSLETERAVILPAKVAYLFNIAKFVAFPGDRATVALCIDESSPLWAHAQSLDGRDLGDGRQLSVRRSGGGACDIAFSDESSAGDVAGGLPSPADGHEVLHVSDMHNATGLGFAIEIYFENERLGFAVNESLIRNASYSVSSKLLRLSRPPTARAR